MATLLVNAGKAVVTARIRGTGTEPLFMAHGTGAGTTAATDTTLFTEATYSGYARVSGTSSQQTTSVTNDTYQLTATLTNNSGGAVAITNAGNFDASSSGNLFVKGDFATINSASSTSTATISAHVIQGTFGRPTDLWRQEYGTNASGYSNYSDVFRQTVGPQEDSWVVRLREFGRRFF